MGRTWMRTGRDSYPHHLWRGSYLPVRTGAEPESLVGQWWLSSSFSALVITVSERLWTPHRAFRDVARGRSRTSHHQCQPR